MTRRQLLKRAFGLMAGTGFAFVMAACSSSQTSSTPSASGTSIRSGTQYTIKMTDQLKFDPAELTIPKGATVTWQNTGQVPHTATDDPSKAANKADASLPAGASPWDSGMMNAGQSWSYTFTVPGEYKYFCIPHEAAGMVGTITVTG